VNTQRLLVANRGEIAVRVVRAADRLGIATVAVYSADDAASLHVQLADAARELPGTGPAAYLDADALLAAADQAGCSMVHPGYGFLSENADFARRCANAGLVFAGPAPETLELFGDKVAARQLAAECGVPTLAGTGPIKAAEQAREFLAALGPGAAIIIKAVAGGGGRGMRVVRDPAEADEALARCRSEAAATFGDGSVYAERLLERARHIEVQIIADHTGAVIALGDRDCSVQRRHQKLIEIAPCPLLPELVRERLRTAAVAMAAKVGYQSLGTFEFLIDSALDPDDPAAVTFIEANPRLQVEHTVTEAATGIDLVAAQLAVADGASLVQLGLTRSRPTTGCAIQARVNLETMAADGTPRPSAGVLTIFEPPTGPGIRTDTFGYAGYQTSSRFDPMLAKVIVHVDADLASAAHAADRALREFRIAGPATNIPFLRAILRHPDFAAGRIYTRFVDDHVAELLGADMPPGWGGSASAVRRPVGTALAGASVDRLDPLAVLEHGKRADPGLSLAPDPQPDGLPDQPWPLGLPEVTAPPGTEPVVAIMQGTIVELDVHVGDLVRAGQSLAVMEAMKMEHVVAAPVGGVVADILVSVGDAVYEGAALAFIEEKEVEGDSATAADAADLNAIRPDLALILERHKLTMDDARPEAVESRHAAGQRTARENIADLCDPGTFIEFGGLGLPTGLSRPHTEVIRRYPADGMVTGIGAVNGSLFGDPAARCAVLAYDYTVLAGTQGAINHRKTDRLLDLASEWKLPVVLFTEGGGGRAGQRGSARRNPTSEPIRTAVGGAADVPTWRRLGLLSGLVPLVGVNSGFSFAGNAALLGCCDVVIATANSSIGMGGPAMVEGGGLGVFRPQEIGPMSVQVPNGVVDIAVADEADAVAVARKYLSYFQGPTSEWAAADQRVLRSVVPENRLRSYDVRRVIEGLADTESVLELRPGFGRGMITALVRIEGRAVGVIANNPQYLSGAVDSDGADKAARFMKICDAFDLPILSLCDTPGIMVGPEAERTGLVRHTARMFVTSANLTVPMIAVVLRKAYGLGVLTMAAGSFKSTAMTLAWPTGEFAGMGLEGQVKLGHRAELAQIGDPAERARRYEELLAAAYESGRAIHQGESYGVDDVIDPAATRSIVAGIFASVRQPAREGKKRPSIDTW
jgi:acetyl/propionyl-CoA carboxylase alpha subunit